MKQSENNGIDTLLRGLARRDRSFGGARDNPVSQAHLDPDELSSYAEGVLPAAARTRYTAHLADCDDCRALVVQLSSASGVLVNEDRLESPGSALTWKQKLLSLFTPVVWRFAMPALALVILGFAIFAWRNREPNQIAMNKQSQRVNATQPSSAVANNQGSAQANNGSATAKPAAKEGDQGEQAGKKEEAKTAEADKSADTKDQKSADGTASTTASQAEAKEKEATKTEAVADKPADTPAPAPAKQAPATAERERQTQAKDEEARVANQQQTDDDVSTNNNVANAKKGGPSQRRAETRAKSRADDDSRGATAGGAVATAGRSGNYASETRTVAGRHFHRQDGLWVDTTFKSQAVTNVARGSEQFRALIADEPEIETIAKALSGDVIVVWKGHVYRIR